MKNIVIAAGYATRLGELTKNFPKPLLEIGSNTILGRMLDDIDKIDDIDEHIIVTNHKFAHIFEEWASEQHYIKPIAIVDDGTETNDTRLGAVCDLLLAIDKCKVNDDILVVAADNLLFFSFKEFIDFAKEKGTSCIMCHEQPSIEKLQRTGVIVVDNNMKVLNMEEKPQEPKSHWAVPPFYIYMKHDLDLVLHSVENGCGKDAPGNLAHYMVDNTTMHAWQMSAGRFDIGSLDTYNEACEKFGGKQNEHINIIFMKEICTIELKQEAFGKNVTVIGQITAKWDRRSFEIENYIDFHIVLSSNGEHIDITNSYSINAIVIGGTDTISIPGSIIFKGVKVEYNRKVGIAGWRENV